MADEEQDVLEKSPEELLEIIRGGGELLVDDSVLADSLVRCGYFEITDQNQDGSEFVLQVKGEVNDVDERSTGEAPDPSQLQPVQVALEIHEEYRDTFKAPVADGLPKQVTDRIWGRDLYTESPGSNSGFEHTVSCTEVEQVQKVHAFVQFRRAYTRSKKDSEEVEVHLMLHRAAFGVESCIEEADFVGHFVHRLEIVASPEDNWSSSCTLAIVRPGDVATPVPRSRAGGWSVGINASAAPAGQVTRTSTTTTGSSRMSHEWLPARSNQEKKSVTWTWVMNTWSDGQKFNAKSTWIKSTKLPKLPVHDPKDVNLIDLESILDATWVVPKKTLNGLQTAKQATADVLLWKILVRVHTTFVRPSLRYNVLGKFVWVRGKSHKQSPFERSLRLTTRRSSAPSQFVAVQQAEAAQREAHS